MIGWVWVGLEGGNDVRAYNEHYNQFIPHNRHHGGYLETCTRIHILYFGVHLHVYWIKMRKYILIRRKRGIFSVFPFPFSTSTTLLAIQWYIIPCIRIHIPVLFGEWMYKTKNGVGVIWHIYVLLYKDIWHSPNFYFIL